MGDLPSRKEGKIAGNSKIFIDHMNMALAIDKAQCYNPKPQIVQAHFNNADSQNIDKHFGNNKM